MDPLEAMIVSTPGVAAVVVAAVWSAIWKAFALYRAGTLRQKGWFTLLFFVNTAGVLEIVYLFAIARKKPSPS